jgi:hypothetical protein
MHRADLESFKGEFLEFNGWGPRRRNALLQKLHPIVKRRTNVVIGSAVLTGCGKTKLIHHTPLDPSILASMC